MDRFGMIFAAPGGVGDERNENLGFDDPLIQFALFLVDFKPPYILEIIFVQLNTMEQNKKCRRMMYVYIRTIFVFILYWYCALCSTVNECIYLNERMHLST